MALHMCVSVLMGVDTVGAQACVCVGMHKCVGGIFYYRSSNSDAAILGLPLCG